MGNFSTRLTRLGKLGGYKRWSFTAAMRGRRTVTSRTLVEVFRIFRETGCPHYLSRRYILPDYTASHHNFRLDRNATRI